MHLNIYFSSFSNYYSSLFYFPYNNKPTKNFHYLYTQHQLTLPNHYSNFHKNSTNLLNKKFFKIYNNLILELKLQYNIFSLYSIKSPNQHLKKKFQNFYFPPYIIDCFSYHMMSLTIKKISHKNTDHSKKSPISQIIF